MPNQSLSVIIASYNCAERIVGTITPWIWADEVIVVDQYSNDSTPELARSAGAKVIQNLPENSNFDLNRKLAMNSAVSDWILYIDTDERPTGELIDEIKSFLKAHNSEINGVRLPNEFYFLGKPLRYGIYNRRHSEIRMVRHGTWLYPCEDGFHRGLSLKTGRVHTMQNSYKHFNVNSLSEWFIKTNQYTHNDASANHIKTWSALVQFSSFIIKHYIFKRGFLDGWRGFLACFYFGLYHFTLNAKSWERSELSKLKQEIDFLAPMMPKTR